MRALFLKGRAGVGQRKVWERENSAAAGNRPAIRVERGAAAGCCGLVFDTQANELRLTVNRAGLRFLGERGRQIVGQIGA